MRVRPNNGMESAFDVPPRKESSMDVRELIALLETIPEELRTRKVVFYDTTNGAATEVRTDVSQFNAYNRAIQVFTKPFVARRDA